MAAAKIAAIAGPQVGGCEHEQPCRRIVIAVGVIGERHIVRGQDLLAQGRIERQPRHRWCTCVPIGQFHQLRIGGD